MHSPPTQLYPLRSCLRFLWCMYGFNLPEPPCPYFTFFFWITDKSFPCPHHNLIFSSLCSFNSIPSLFLSLPFVLVVVLPQAWLWNCESPWNNFFFLSLFLLFYLFHHKGSRASLLSDLSKHKRYEIRLSVYNAVGEGPSSAPQEVFVGEAGTCWGCSWFTLA